MTNKTYTNHALIRLAQRNLETTDIDFVVKHGKEVHRCGTSFFFLGKKDIPDAFAKSHAHLNGATVIADEREVITAYRDRNALRKIKRKSKIGNRNSKNFINRWPMTSD